MQSEPTYRIKPLEWKEDTFPNGKHIDIKRRFRAKNAVVEIVLTEERDGFKEIWNMHIIGVMPRRLHKVATLDAAKQAAEAAYRERLATALEVVTDAK